MRYFSLTAAALLGLSLLTVSVLPAHAQNVSVDALLQQTEATSTPTTIAPTPNPFPVATTAPAAPEQPVVNEPEPASTTTPQEESEPVIEVKKPVISPPKKKAGVITPATSTATTTASSTIGFIPPPLIAQSIGNIYTFARHAPLDTETTRGFLGVAALLALLGSLMVQKNILDRMMYGLSRISTPSRSLSQPQAKR